MCYKGGVPKVVDAQQRRSAIADATITVIARAGVDHATLANVAREAGLVIGSVRHYFTSQADMVSHAMRQLSDRIAGRVLRVAEPVIGNAEDLDPGRRRAITDEVFCELLPLDEPRRREAMAWLALSVSAVNRPDLRPVVDELHDGIRTLTRTVLRTIRTRGRLDVDDETLELEVERLAALLDGLATDAVLSPHRHPPDQLRAVLRHHLNRLVGD